MKHLTILLLTLLVLGGCSSEYDKCVEIETKKNTISDEIAETRAKNICFKEPVKFINQEAAIQAHFEEEYCIEENMLKIQNSNKRAELKANDICTMRIFDKDFER
tara:strand:- start:1167 stop:1481 length:315 start_codon:yes stop_codon:yes gene_type:complete